MAGLGFSSLGIIGAIVVFIVLWIISSLSVYISARIIKINVPFLRVLIVTLIADIVPFIIGLLTAHNLVAFIIGLIIGFVIALVIYKYLFDIDWIKTFVMLIIANIIAFGIIVILSLIFAAISYFALGSAFSSLSAAP